MRAVYLESEAYNRLVDALLHVETDVFSGKVDSDGIKLTLGEFGEIWPESIREDAEAHNR